MNKARSETEKFILDYLKRIAPGSNTAQVHQKFFSTMDDDEFDSYISDLEKGTKTLIIFAPNFSKHGITLENNVKIAEELGHSFFERLWINEHNGLPTYLTPIKYLHYTVIARRASQTLDKKSSIPENMKTIDAITYQPTGPSKGAKISKPEAELLTAMDLTDSAVELMKVRGGDKGARLAYVKLLSNLGSASLNDIEKYSTGVESTRTLQIMLYSAMIGNNLLG